jgi:outer membrane lipoprotein-sorting protein
MFPIKPLKFFCALFLASMIFSSCSFWQTDENQNTNSNTFVAEEIISEIPFENKEPEIYQAEIVLITYSNGEKTERIIKAARLREKIRYDYPNGTSFMQINESERFMLETEKKIYVQNQMSSGNSTESGNSLKDFLTTEWLNEKRDAKFENLGTENALVKYRVSIENTNLEILIYVDANLKFPVKQEFYSISGDQKTLLSAMEIRNLKLEVDENLFELPKDFRKVSIKEFQKIVREKRIKSE